MHLDYRLSLWNYFWYHTEGSLEDVADEVRAGGFGIELWERWKETCNLYAPRYRDRLRALVRGMKCSLHGRGCKDLDDHIEQIGTARHIGADVIVVHLGHFAGEDNQVDLELLREVTLRAEDAGLRLALENGAPDGLARAFERVGDALGFCLDTGHRHGLERPVREFLDMFGERLIHLHLQDPEEEVDHWELGTGINTPEDWRCLKEHLEEMDFSGAVVFEIRPRRPVAVAERSIRFFERV